MKVKAYFKTIHFDFSSLHHLDLDISWMKNLQTKKILGQNSNILTSKASLRLYLLPFLPSAVRRIHKICPARNWFGLIFQLFIRQYLARFFELINEDYLLSPRSDIWHLGRRRDRKRNIYS